ncbi:MAG: hypothetical protein JNL11_16145 [Bdellovibrionaceae bacterium]|nr:hypothetical protein [Pseudobdellovibrionaceae bacterium]
MFKWMEQIQTVKSELQQLATVKTTKDLEQVLEKLSTNPQLLNTLSIVLNTQSQIKSLVNFSFEKLWKNLQLPNKKDQERTLYLLHELQFKIHQMEKEMNRFKKSIHPNQEMTSLPSRPITFVDKRATDKPISKMV